MTDRETIEKLLPNIDPSALDYQQWVSVGMILHDNGMSWTDWDSWSRNDRRYHSGECERKWSTFGNGYSGALAGIGSLYQMARDQGFTEDRGTAIGWDDSIDDDDVIIVEGWHKDHTNLQMPKSPQTASWNGKREIIDYLTQLFNEDDFVCVVNDAYLDDDGKWKPHGGHMKRTAGKLIDELRKKEMGQVFGDFNEDAGAWVCFNPVDGNARSNKNITEFRYALVESDDQDIETQYALMQDLKLPIRILVHSGGKSLHAIVEINAVDYRQYQERVERLYTICRKNGLHVDQQDKNPSRLSRLPGVMRGGKKQYIIAKRIGCGSYEEWLRYIETESAQSLPTENVDLQHLPQLAPELISGVLRQGHKMMISSSSKAGKTFLLIELAVAIGEGIDWIGLNCRRGKVLYLNMELDSASFKHRLANVYKALEIENPDTSMIDIINLRGKSQSLGELSPRIIRTAREGKYAAIILDPIYKLGIGDENAAEQVAKFCNAVDQVAESTGASMIYVHHHSKGAQGSKSSMDRASGSGVFARDADAMIDLIELSIEDGTRQALGQYIGQDKAQDCTAWRVESTLREFKRLGSFNVIFAHPIHEVDLSGLLDSAQLSESVRALADGREKGAIANKSNKQTRVEAFREAVERDMDWDGHGKTAKQYAEEFATTERTIREYCKVLGASIKQGAGGGQITL